MVPLRPAPARKVWARWNGSWVGIVKKVSIPTNATAYTGARVPQGSAVRSRDPPWGWGVPVGRARHMRGSISTGAR